jgi:gag-polyprotein putative aspartyl protease
MKTTDVHRRKSARKPASEDMAQQIVLSNEQFQTLLEQIGNRDRNQDIPSDRSTYSTRAGNFVKCTARFDGNSSDVDSFLSAIDVFKDCAEVSDENALKGLPMLLTNNAATWWLGIKSSISTWEQAICALRNAFGKKRAPFQVYKELFRSEQGIEIPTDLFVSKCRALLSEIPDQLSEKVQIDMVYGLLNYRIRKYVPRDTVSTFNNLLSSARTVEQSLEDKVEKSKIALSPTRGEIKDRRSKCNYCRKQGHTMESCRSLLRKKESEAVASAPSSSVIACYGCGRPGTIRAKCPKCKPTGTSVLNASFHTFENVKVARRPLIPINVLEFHNIATADTGATRSIMSRNLYQRLEKKCRFVSTKIVMTLADGEPREITVQVADVPLTIYGRSIISSMIVLSGDRDNHTLLGMDVLNPLGIVLDTGSQTWYFRDTPTVMYPFADSSAPLDEAAEKESETFASYDMVDPCLRCDEGVKLTPSQKIELNCLLEDNKAIFELGGEPTDAIEHCINTVPNQVPISMPPYRLSSEKKRILREEIDSMLEANIIEECDSPWAAPVVLAEKRLGHVLVEAKENFEREQERQKQYADIHHRPAPTCKSGDLVLLKVHQLSNAARGITAKLLPKRDGPYKIRKAVTATTYLIEDSENSGQSIAKVHTSKLTPFIGEPQTPTFLRKRKRGRLKKAGPSAGR